MIGTDADVDRRLSAVAEIDIPFYRGLQIGVPSLPAIVETLAEGRYDLVHLTLARAGGDRRLAAGAGARPAGRRQLPHRAGRLRGPAHRRGPAGGDRRARRSAPSTAPATWSSPRARPATSGWPSSESLDRVARWDRGVDLDRFDPRLRDAGDASGGEINVLYAGRLTKEKGVDLLADAFLRARDAGPAAAPGAGRRRPRGGGAARAPRRPRAPSWAGWREGPAHGLRQRRRVPVRQPDRHLRPGHPRGPGQRDCRSSRSPRAARCR